MTGGRVLITGAGGFVGGHLVSGFLAQGHAVTGIDRAFDPAARRRLAGADLVTGAVCGRTLAGLPQASIIIHAAALTTGPDAAGITPVDHVHENIEPLLAILRHTCAAPPAAFVFVSSSGVFGPSDGSPDLTDTTVPTATGPYSAAKRAGEVLVPAALAQVCKTWTLRLGHLYGPHEQARPTRKRVSLLQGWIEAAGMIDLPDPGGRREWTFAPDLAAAIARIVAAPQADRPLHVCSPEVTRDDALAAMIAARRGLPLRKVAGGPVKPPMVPSRIAALDEFAWTPLAAGLDMLLAERATA